MRNLDYADAGIMLVLVSHFVAYFLVYLVSLERRDTKHRYIT